AGDGHARGRRARRAPRRSPERRRAGAPGDARGHLRHRPGVRRRRALLLRRRAERKSPRRQAPERKTPMTATPKIVSREEWLDARRALLAREKEHTRARDALSAARRALPWGRVDKRYVFHGAAGEDALAHMFPRPRPA